MNKIRARQNASYRFFHVIFFLRKIKRKIIRHKNLQFLQFYLKV